MSTGSPPHPVGLALWRSLYLYAKPSAHLQFHKSKTSSAALQNNPSCIRALWTDEYPHPRIAEHYPGTPKHTQSREGETLPQGQKNGHNFTEQCSRRQLPPDWEFSDAGLHSPTETHPQDWPSGAPALWSLSCAAHLDVSAWSNSLFPCWDPPPPWTEVLFGTTWPGISLGVEVLLGVRLSVLQPSRSRAHRCTDTNAFHHCDLLAAKFPAKVLEI